MTARSTTTKTSSSSSSSHSTEKGTTMAVKRRGKINKKATMNTNADAKEEEGMTEERTMEDAVVASSKGATTTTIADVIRCHLDARQRECDGIPAYAAACALRRDILSFYSSIPPAAADGDVVVVESRKEGREGDVADAFVSCLDAAMSTIMRRSSSSSKKGGGCYDESIASVWDTVASFACLSSSSSSSGSRGGGGVEIWGIVPLAITNRVSMYASLFECDACRLEACRFLGMMVRNIIVPTQSSTTGIGAASSDDPRTKVSSILKNGGGGGKRTRGGGRNMEREGGGGEHASAATPVAHPWEVECLVLAANALLKRATDKISKVRHAAILACGPLLTLLAKTNAMVSSSSSSSSSCDGHRDDVASIPAREKFLNASSRSLSSDLVVSMNALASTLLWSMRNDPSASNRCAAIGIFPPLARRFSVVEGGEEDEQRGNEMAGFAMRAIVERIGDVDVRVRGAALDSLRNNVRDYAGEMSGDMRADVLRKGLTRRCPATYAKTVELLCTNWLKSTRYDPIALLESLDPVMNERTCEEVSRVLLRVASTIDVDGCVDGGVELVRSHLGGPEVRSLVENVLGRRGIVDRVVATSAAEDDDVAGNPSAGMSPAMALFLRVKCEMSSSTEAVADIIVDVPTLCGLLNERIDELIAFHDDDDGAYNEMDDDEAVAFEDGRNFVCLQLMRMARSSELHREEGSRRHLVSIMRRILARLATPDDLVEACVKAMASAHDKESQFLQTISEVLADVEDDDTYQSRGMDPRAIVIVRQMRIIAILSIVLESVSGNVTSHPILDTFFEHLSPAITSKNAVVREHGVICLSKFCLLSGEDKVMGEFCPLLFTIAGSVEERVEVRAQAALALCDLALIHERMLIVSATSDAMPSFKDMILGMLGHSKPGIVIIAAEIAAKLLLAGRLNDPALIAWLVLVYFDSSLTTTVGTDLEDDDAEDGGPEVASKKVGSPVRLQQLLSIFFPTYSMSSLDANDDMMASVGPLLSIVNKKLSGLKPSDVKAAGFPIAKMIEYICYNVDLADKKKSEESKNVSFVMKVTCEEGITHHYCGSETMENSQRCDSGGNTSNTEDGEEVVIEASSILLASIDIAEFLSEECDSAPLFFVRVLAKILASARIDVAAEDNALLRRLKSCLGEAEYANDDGPTVKSIKKLADLLVDVDDEGASSDDETDPFKEDESTVSRSDVNFDGKETSETRGSVEKENSRLSVGSSKSMKSADGERRMSSSSLRVRLADVNN